MPKLVSILIPAYNAEKWIAETIRSALGQTWPRTEIIIVDDGSSDRTSEIAHSFASVSVKVVRQQNAGPCFARNAAYALSQGDYIQWLDSDDLLAPDKIERQMARVADSADGKTLLSAAYGTFYYNASKAYFEPTSVWRDLDPKEFLIRKFTDNAHMVIHSWLISRAIADSAGAWDIRLQKTDGDGEYTCRLVAASDRIVFVPEARCYYRKGLSGSLSATRTHIEDEHLLLRLLFDRLLAVEDSDETRSACVKWLKTWAGAYYPINPDALGVVEAMGRYLGCAEVTVPISSKFLIAEKILGWQGARNLKSTVAKLRTWIGKYQEKVSEV
jgi:GT2 family glycosyltransferase